MRNRINSFTTKIVGDALRVLQSPESMTWAPNKSKYQLQNLKEKVGMTARAEVRKPNATVIQDKENFERVLQSNPGKPFTYKGKEVMFRNGQYLIRKNGKWYKIKG